MTANPNLFLSGDEFLQHKIDQARRNAQDTLDANEAKRRAHEKEAADLMASIYEDAAEIALSGIGMGLDSAACYGISSALKLQAMIVRGDTTS